MKEYNIYLADTEQEKADLLAELSAQQTNNQKAYTSINIVATKKFNVAPTNPSYPSFGGIAIIGDYLYALKSRNSSGKRLTQIFKCKYKIPSSPNVSPLLSSDKNWGTRKRNNDER